MFFENYNYYKIIPGANYSQISQGPIIHIILTDIPGANKWSLKYFKIANIQSKFLVNKWVVLVCCQLSLHIFQKYEKV